MTPVRVTRLRGRVDGSEVIVASYVAKGRCLVAQDRALTGCSVVCEERSMTGDPRPRHIEQVRYWADFYAFDVVEDVLCGADLIREAA